MKLFGEFLIEMKLINQEQLLEAILVQVESLPTIPSILKNNNLMNATQILAAFKHQVRHKTDFRKSSIALNLWSETIENEVQKSLSKVRIPLGEILISLGHLKMEDMTRSLQEYLSLASDNSHQEMLVIEKDELEILQTLLDENQKKSFLNHLNGHKVQPLRRDLKRIISAFRVTRIGVGEQVCLSLDQLFDKIEIQFLESSHEHWNQFRTIAEKIILIAWNIKVAILESQSEIKWRQGHQKELVSLKRELLDFETLLLSQSKRVS